MTVTVRAIRDFCYHGSDVRAGALVDMLPIDASAHARSGHVSLAKILRRDVTPEPEPEPVPTPRRRRSYRRRDVTAESAALD